MKKALLLILLFSPLSASAQWSVSTTPKIVFVNPHDNIFDYDSKASFGIDILASYKFNFGASLSTGLDYTFYKWETVYNELLPFDNMKNELKSFSIPIYADYEYKLGRFTPFAGLGVLIGINDDFYFQGRSVDESFSGKAKISAHVGCKYLINDNMYLGLVGSYNKYIEKTKFLNNSLSLQPSSFNVGLTIGYRF